MGALNIGLSGLRAAQVGMDVTSHNIANVNTANYQRQVVDLKDVVYNSGSPQIPSGAGVAVSSIHNVNDPLLNSSYPQALSNSAEYGALADLGKNLDGLVNNPSLNLTQAMQDTFNAFQDVADTPTSIPIRQNAIEKAQAFSDKATSLLGEMNTLKSTVTSGYSDSADKVNSLVDNIAQINNQIRLSDSQTSASLESQRDSLTLDLSNLTGIEVSSDKSSIKTTSGKTLISSGIKASHLTEADIPSITGGSIGGTNKFVTTMLNPAIDKLPDVVNHVATEINKQAVQGYDLNGNVGTAIFNVTPGSLSGLSVNITDPKTLGASTSVTGTGDGTNAQKIADINKQLFGGQTLQSQYSSILSGLDSKAKSYSDMSTMYSSVSDNIGSQIKNISGVNLDEEAANLLKYQQMYQANAQVIKTQNEMFGTLINMTA